MALWILTCSFVVVPQSATEPSRLLEIVPVAAPLTAARLSEMTVSSFEQVLGRKMTFRERVAFTVARRDLRRQIREGAIHGASCFDANAYLRDGDGGFRFGAFLVGFFFGIFGWLIVLLASKDPDARNSALQGAAISGLITLLTLLL